MRAAAASAGRITRGLMGIALAAVALVPGVPTAPAEAAAAVAAAPAAVPAPVPAAVPGAAATFRSKGERSDEVLTYGSSVSSARGASCPSDTVCFLASQELRRSDDGGRTWVPLATPPFLYGFVDVDCASVERCVALTTSGLAATTTDGGTTWNVVTMGIVATLISCPSATTCYAAGTASLAVGAAPAIAVSHDGGATWGRTAVPDIVMALTGLDCPSETACRAVGTNTVLRTSDGGAHWDSVTTAPGIAPDIACPTTQVCLVTVGQGTTQVLRSIDGGASFSALFPFSAPSPSGLNRIECPSAITCVAAGGFGVDGGTVRIDVASGGFTVGSPRPEANGLSVLACTTAHCVALGRDPVAFRTGRFTTVVSDDGGATFASVPNTAAPSVADVACPTATRCVAVGQTGVPTGVSGDTGALVTVTDDLGATWHPGSVPTAAGELRRVMCGSPATCVAIEATTGLLRSNDAGATWSAASLPPTIAQLFAVACPSASVCLATGIVPGPSLPGDGYRLLRSVDGGATWTVVVGAPPGSGELACTADGRCLLLGVQSTGPIELAFSTDRGASWTPVSGPAGRAPSGGLRCSASTCLLQTFDMAHSYELFATTDVGATWTSATGSALMVDRLCAPDGSCLGVSTDAGGRVATSTDGGSTWSTAAAPPTVRSFGRVACPEPTRCLVFVLGGAQRGTAVWRITLVPPTLRAVVPGRLYDSRPGLPTVDGMAAGGGLRAAGATTVVRVAGRGGVGGDAASAVLTVTATEAAAPGFLTVWPCDASRPTASSLNYATGATVANTVVAKLAADGTVCVYHHAATHLVVDAVGFLRAGSPVDALVPGRVFESRPGLETVDGRETGGSLRAAGGTTVVTIAGRAGVPVGTGSAILTVTVTEARAPGFVTVWPCDAPRPTASSLNHATGATVANTVVAKLAADGTVCIYHHAATHLIVDAVGAMAATSPVTAIVPGRVYDSRPGFATVDGIDAGAGLRSNDAVTSVTIAGRAGVPADAMSAILTVTVTETTGPGYLTVWPCDAPRPTASSLNHATGATVANTVVAKLAAGGTVCVYHQRAVHLVVDAVGFE